MRTKRIGTFVYVLAIVALTVGFFNCKTSDNKKNQIMNGDVPIGVVVALTGRHAKSYGFSMQRGFELAREEINNRGDIKLTFITVDDQSTPEGAKDAVQHLVDQGVSAIVGLAISTHLKAAAPIAQEGKVIAFS